jgi:hypothetical protein
VFAGGASTRSPYPSRASVLSELETRVSDTWSPVYVLSGRTSREATVALLAASGGSFRSRAVGVTSDRPLDVDVATEFTTRYLSAFPLAQGTEVNAIAALGAYDAIYTLAYAVAAAPDRSGAGVAAGLAQLEAALRSACTLGRDLEVPQIALRLDETTKLDEPVILGGHCLTSGTPRRRDVASIVSEVTFELGTPSAPPRALVMPDAASSFDLGGGVLSSETGALIAVIASGRNPSCAAANPDGSLAIRIAPFRRMLLDAAASRGVTLRAEATDQTSAALMPCADD